jgi:uncharacterized protein YfaS (alpha-2-macroglobulin family)
MRRESYCRKKVPLMKPVFEAIRHVVRAVFGQLAWTAPAWLQTIKRGLAAARQARPRLFKAGIVALLVTIVLACGGYWIWRHMPVPIRTEISATPPDISAVDADGKIYPQPAYLDFNTHYTDPRVKGPRGAARLDLVQKDVTSYIVMTPPHPGKWRWQSESRLIFEPARDWPAGQKYTVTLKPALFAAAIHLASTKAVFTTPAFEAEIDQLNFYQDPKTPSIHKVTATLSFTYPVDEAGLKAHLGLGMRPSGADITVQPEQYPFSLRFEPNGRTAYVMSEPLQLPEQESFMRLVLGKGLKSISGPGATAKAVSQEVRIPSVTSYFRVASIQTRIVRNEDNEPEQTLIVQFTDGVKTDIVTRTLQAYVLPANGRQYRPADVNAAVLAASQPLKLTGNPTEHDYSRIQSYRFKAPEYRSIYIRIPEGLVSQGGFKMTVPYAAVQTAPAYPREAKIMGQGALIALSGDKRLSFVSRGVPALRIQLFRLLPDQLVHLVTQTQGNLEEANFIDDMFNEEDIAEQFQQILPLNMTDPAKAQYASLDLAPFLGKGPTRRGMFILRLEAWDPQRKRVLGDVHDRRFLMVTDLGVVAKDNADHTHDVFVHSLSLQQPLANVDVALLGKNGQTLMSRTSDAQGHVSFPDVSDFKFERQPVAYLLQHKGDIVFLPYDQATRKLNFSRFDVGGLFPQQGDEADQLRAVIFSDRGMYRPGEDGHFGIIVKRNDWRTVGGVAVDIELDGPRGNTFLKERQRLPEDGFIEQAFKFRPTDDTGQYQAAVYLLGKDDKRKRLLGSTAIQVEEFQPDTMRIHTAIVGGEAAGWRVLQKYQGVVSLENLFGLPAQQRRVEAEYRLSPARFNFKKFDGFVFEDPYRDVQDRLTRSVSERLPRQTSDAKGAARFDIDLSSYGAGLFRLNFTAEGYETGGGRSVSAASGTLVSPAERLVGWKADGDLNYIKRGVRRTIRFIVINPELKPLAADDLTLRLIEERPVSTLVQQRDGTLQYQTVIKDVLLTQTSFPIPAKGGAWQVPADQPGDYRAELWDKDGHVAAAIRFKIIGARNLAGKLEKNAELRLDLARHDVAPGETIEMQITAPYAGSGLITVERDRVYAFKWFRADSSRSVQRIVVPAGLEGNAYVNVTFVRALDSKEIFTQPLSYAVAPFNIDRSARTVGITLQAPAKVKPGEPLAIRFSTSRPARIELFAVDEGILQTAHYQTPQPLSEFMQKRALQVQTSQIADLLMPEFNILRALAAPGGGEAAAALLGKNLNPFQRGVNKPVVFWSGIIATDGRPQTVSYTVPDYFDGELRIMAVAVAPQAVGSAASHVTVRGPFVLQPNAVTMAAPGDKFDVSVGVTNALPADSGVDQAQVRLAPSPQLSVVGPAQQTLTVAPGQEKRARFSVRANAQPGPAKLVFTAAAGEHTVSRTTTLSIRPAVPYRTTLAAGMTQSGKGELTLDRRLMPQLAAQVGSVGYSPLILADGLRAYLQAYPYGCTEQLVSKVFPLLGLTGDPALDIKPSALRTSYDEIVSVLRARQIPNGGFAFWPGQSESDDFISIYAMHFLTDAALQNVAVPTGVLKSGLDYLHTIVRAEPRRGHRAYLQAYAIYVLTRNGEVTTNYLTRLQEFLEKSDAELNKKRDRDARHDWRSELAAAYMAASYKQLKLNDLANELIAEYAWAKSETDTEWSMDSALARNAQYVYLLARHFPERLHDLSDEDLQGMLQPVIAGRFNTLSSAYTILALGAWGEEAGGRALGPLSISSATNQQQTMLAQGPAPVQRAKVALNLQKLVFKGDSGAHLFYTATQSGYDLQLPDKAVSNGLEIVREYLDKDGQPVTRAGQGAELTVRLKVRSLNGMHLDNVAVVDLLPGGFEVQRDSIRKAAGDWQTDYVDIREERVVFYGRVDPMMHELHYRVKLTGAGSFTIPPAFAESMYHPDIQAQSMPGRFEVTAPH